MISRFWVYSGDRPSNGAKELAASEGFLRLRQGREHKIKAGDIFINWGNSIPLALFGVPKILNTCAAIKMATDKLVAFKTLSDAHIPTVPWTVDPVVVFNWCVDGHTVVVRNKLTGHSGDGILIIEKNSINELADIPKAPLYTKYVWKEKEFRVHVVGDNAIDTQQKIKDPDREVKSWKVRSHDNGFIFARNNVAADPTRDSLAVAAVKALGLDFGAVDIVQDKKGNLYVLEINTAPGLEGQTITSYAEAFRGSYTG